jgi:ATP-dependent RNA helicase DeaD
MSEENLKPVKIIEPENPLPDYTLEQLAESLQNALRENGWQSLMPVQAKTIPYMLEGKNLLVQSKTGSGKTGAFGIPLIQIIQEDYAFPQALILVPTRELALQVEEEIQKMAKGRDIRSVAIYGGVAYGPQIDKLKNGVHIVVATPGRLLDLLESKHLDFKSVRDLVMDEADELLSMGFYPDMRRIKGYLPKQFCCTMFSATMPETVKSLAKEFQSAKPVFLGFSYGHVAAENLDHYYHVVEAMDKDSTVVKILEMENPDSCIIFCNMKRDVAYLEEYLCNYGFKACGLSGDINQRMRQKVLKKFRNREVAILIATDVAARGIDISHVSHVILHDHPDDREVYIHRSGRTARAGRSGVAISIVTSVEELELKKTGVEFNIPFVKAEPLADDIIASRIRQRTIAFLEREKRNLPNKAKNRIHRLIPLVEQLASINEEKDLLAFLLDQYYWNNVVEKASIDPDEEEDLD